MTTVFDRLDATLELPDHEAMVLESVSRLARDVVAPRAADYDRREACPVENIEAMNALGMNAMFVPEAYGGLGLSYPVYLACVRELSKACASTGIIWATRSEEHTSELQSLMRISYAVFCLKKKTKNTINTTHTYQLHH